MQIYSLSIPMPESKQVKLTAKQLYVVTEITIEHQSKYGIEFEKIN
jgi:hypothetical protein